ncbi:hypothetical protein SCP_0212150 [Sparassis crispa]|uniref:Uncharacterized protein n=1 Tax=Sparassis crispa TaxID=139825 RepID=A0A401GD20_9APHY|nr:hypothetical protein SCP_0212150 [Sparassis crispa]GBE80013.1 hypothetical protein SCP_0212150 [Sparassis crispa]
MVVLAEMGRLIQLQLLVAAASILCIQDEFTSAKRISEDSRKKLQCRIKELEAEKEAMASRIGRLETENAELKRLLEEKEPDLRRAIDERDATQCKLASVRMTIRKLLSEKRERVNAEKLEYTTAEERALVELSGEQPWDEAGFTDQSGGGSPKSGPSSEDDDNPQATIPQAKQTDTTGLIGESLRDIIQETGTRPGNDKTAKEGQQAREQAPTGVRTASSVRKEQTTVASQEGWYLEYFKPPATAELSVGGWLYEQLAEHLQLDNKTTICNTRYVNVENLPTTKIEKAHSHHKWWQDACMHIHIHNDIAFLFNPIVLEGPSTTYLISWGTRKINRKVEKYISRDRAENPAFHLLVLPAEKEAWWYLGMHSFTIAQVLPVWSILNSQDKDELTLELKKRWDQAPGGQRIATMLEQGDLQQCTIELRSEGLADHSLAFLHDQLGMSITDCGVGE